MAPSGVVSTDCGIGGNACPKLGCIEVSKMGSCAFENGANGLVAGTGFSCVSSCNVKLVACI